LTQTDYPDEVKDEHVVDVGLHELVHIHDVLAAQEVLFDISVQLTDD
jgi:hypothetical protein